MLALLRDGYGREIAALFILTALAGAAIAGGVGALVDRWLAESVESLAGVPGQYDILVQLRADAGGPGLSALRERLEEIVPGYRLKEGPTLLGRANVFVGFPGAHRNATTFETIEEYLRNLPGYEGMSVIVEPAVTVKGVHPSARGRFLEEALRVPGALFGFERHGSLWIVADRPDAAEDVRRELQALAEGLGVLSVNTPAPLDEAGREAAKSIVTAALASGDSRVRALPVAVEEAQAARDLAEVKRLLLEMGGADREEFRQALERAREAISRAAAEGSVREDIAAALDAFEQAVLQLENFERRAQELGARIREAAGSGPAEVLIALLFERLIGGARGDEAPARGALGPAPDGEAGQGGKEAGGAGSGGTGPGSDEPGGARRSETGAGGSAVDVEQLKSGIASLADRLVAIESIDFDALIGGLRRLEESLASFDPETERRILELIDRAIEAQGGEGLRLEFLLEGEWASVDAEALLGAAGLESAKAYVRPAGVVEPDPRTVLSQALGRAADAVALLAAVLVVSLFFVFDMATVVSFVREGAASAAAALGAALWGGLWTATSLSAVVWLAGHWEGPALFAPCAGFALGVLLSLVSHRLSPVDSGEVRAGLSLGLRGAEILREIVVPGGRPGMLAWLNNFGRRLSGAGSG